MLRHQRTAMLSWLSLALLVVLAVSCGPATTAPSGGATPVPAATAGPARGGTVTIAFSEEPNSMDAILGYNIAAWQSLMNLYRGLMIYEGDRAVPDMAADYPDISADGTVYTFTLRPGVRFHNGREVEAADFKYSLERCLDPAWGSWANYYLLSIEGAQDMIDGNAAECSGIEVLDRYTLRFRLTAPDMTFLNVLALPNNWVVPKEEVERWGEEFGLHPVGTGPFIFQEYTPGEKAVFVRNPDFFHAGQPYIDQVIMYFGVEPSTALMRLERGDLDILFGDMIPAADFPRLVGDSKYQDWFFREPSMYTWWIGVNNAKPPLDNVAFRQALNLAIDREKIARLMAGKGVALWTIYPATCPGYDPSYRPYSYDPAAARAKMAQAGVAEGLELELLIVADDPQEATMAQSIQQDLGQIGIRLSIKQVADTVAYDLMYAGDTELFLNSWYMIQPDAADLINNLYMTGAGSNYDFYSNPRVDELAMQALGEQDRSTRLQLYQQIERLLMDDAVHVPLINGISFYLHNPRLKDFYSRSEYGPFLERLWIQP